MDKQHFGSILKYQSAKQLPILNRQVADNERVLILSPTVKAGLERECTKDDFEKEGRGLIGKGGFGEVWKVIHKKTRKVYCIKIVGKQGIINQKLQGQMNREIEIMYALNHPHCLRLKNHFEDNENFYLVMPLASKGQLYKALKQHRIFDEKTAAQYLRETILALKYLHSFNPPIIHRDLKPENLLLTDSSRVLLADFGWSNFSESEAENRKTFCGTPEYIAPEMLKKEGHDYRVDIWSVGILMFEFLAGYSPFIAKSNQDLYQNIRKLKIKWPSDMPPLAKNLISRILKLVPTDRLSLDQILEHEWFKRTPEIRPGLVNDLNNDRDLMIYHMLSPATSDVLAKINEIVQVDSPNSPLSSAQSPISQEPEEKRKSIIHEIKEKNQNQQHNGASDVSKEESERLNYANHKLNQEIQYMRGKLANSESEIKALRNEILKLKETNPIALQDKIRQQNEVIEELRVGEKYRLEALSDIEEKNTMIRDLNSKLQMMEGEKIQADKEFEALKNQLKESSKAIESKEVVIEQLNKKNNSLNQDKEDLFLDYQKKMELLQVKVLQCDSNSGGDGDSSSSATKVIHILNESVEEFKNIFKKKMDSFIEHFNQFKDEYKKKNEKINSLVNDKTSLLNEMILNSTMKFIANMQKTLENATKLPSNIKELQMEWLKKQIQELTPYKTKVFECERKIQEYQHKLSFFEEMKMLQGKMCGETNKSLELNASRTKDFVDNFKFLKSYIRDFLKSIDSYVQADEGRRKKVKQIYEKFDFNLDII